MFYCNDNEVLSLVSDSNPVEDYENEDMKRVLYENFYVLTDTEKEVLTLRFGLNGETPQTLRKIGEKFNVQQERIRQKQSKAIEKLRELVLENKTFEYFDL